MTTETMMDEMLSRVRRTETRVYKLCEKMGVEPHPEQLSADIHCNTDGALDVVLAGYDVTLSQVKKELARQGFTTTEPILLSVRAGGKTRYLGALRLF